MKAQKNKLKFEKFRVSKLNNLNIVNGGNGDDDGVTTNQTDDPKATSSLRCILQTHLV